MKVKFYHWYNFLLGALLSVVGYGCSSNGDEPVMYGSPTDNYQISGVVTDENGNPVEGIKTSLKNIGSFDCEGCRTLTLPLYLLWNWQQYGG